MALGPGKYDELCTQVRARANADGVLLIVFNGSNGSGFSAQADIETTLRIPEILEAVAAQIRADRGLIAN